MKPLVFACVLLFFAFLVVGGRNKISVVVKVFRQMTKVLNAFKNGVRGSNNMAFSQGHLFPH